MRRLEYALALGLIAGVACTQIPLPGIFGTLNRAVGILLVLVWIPASLRGEWIRRPDIFHLLLLGLVTWNFLSLVWTADMETGLDKIQRYGQCLLSSVVLWDILRRSRQVEMGLQAFVLGAALTIGPTIYDYLYGVSHYAEIGRYAAAGFDPNELGAQIAMAFPSAVCLFFLKGQRNRMWRILNGFFPAIAVIAVVLSGSRGSIVALVPGALYWLWKMFRAGFLTKGVALTVLLAAFLVVSMLNVETSLGRLLTIGTAASTDRLNGRLDIWQAGFNLFLSAPLIGVGLGSFASMVFLYLNYPAVAHNTYVSVAAETGAIGMLLFLMVVGSVVFRILSHKGPWRGAYAATFASWALAAAALTWEDVPQTWLVLTLLLAGCLAQSDEAQSSPPATVPADALERTNTPGKVTMP